MRARVAVGGSRARTAAKVVAFAPNDKPATKVKFIVQQKVTFGRHIAIVGNTSPLSWSEPLELKWTDGDVWSGSAVLPAG